MKTVTITLSQSDKNGLKKWIAKPTNVKVKDMVDFEELADTLSEIITHQVNAKQRHTNLTSFSLDRKIQVEVESESFKASEQLQSENKAYLLNQVKPRVTRNGKKVLLDAIDYKMYFVTLFEQIEILTTEYVVG